MNKLETAIIKNISIEHPVALQIIESCHVLNRQYMGSGSVTNFEVIQTPLLTDSSTLYFPKIVRLDNGLELTAHLQLNKGIPEYLEIKCTNWGGWDGSFESFTIIEHKN